MLQEKLLRFVGNVRPLGFVHDIIGTRFDEFAYELSSHDIMLFFLKGTLHKRYLFFLTVKLLNFHWHSAPKLRSWIYNLCGNEYFKNSTTVRSRYWKMFWKINISQVSRNIERFQIRVKSSQNTLRNTLLVKL